MMGMFVVLRHGDLLPGVRRGIFFSETLSGRASVGEGLHAPPPRRVPSWAAGCEPLALTGVMAADDDATTTAIELHALTAIADLSQYALGVAASRDALNAGGPAFTFPAVPVAAGTFLYVTDTDAGFQAFFGFAPTYVSASIAADGDEAVGLFHQGALFDTFADDEVGMHTKGRGLRGGPRSG